MNVAQVDTFTEVSVVNSGGGHNWIFEGITVDSCGGRAFFHEVPWNKSSVGTYMPDYDTTRYINCDAFNCADILPYTPPADRRIGNQSDGFKTYGDPGSVVIYEHCRCFNMSDDG